MKAYVFCYGVDGFGADVAPAHEMGCYLDFNKALEKCMELNREEYEKCGFSNDDRLVEICLSTEPLIDFYSIEEIEIIE